MYKVVAVLIQVVAVLASVLAYFFAPVFWTGLTFFVWGVFLISVTDEEYGRFVAWLCDSVAGLFNPPRGEAPGNQGPAA